MATPPFSPEFVAKLKQATGWRFNAQLGPVFTPRFFCCSDPNALGISDGKAPVAVLDLAPIPCIVGDVVAFDGTGSYDPDGAVASYAWTFQGGAPASSAADSGNVSWATPGEYEVTLVVTDGTGLKSSPARVKMVVWEPSGKYYAATANGVYFTLDGGQAWTAKNTGLAGDALVVNDLKIDPATQNAAENKKVLWIATDGGLYLSIDGAANWTQKNPGTVANTWGDAPAPAVADLHFEKVLFYGELLFAIATWQNAGGDERSFLFRASDAGKARSDTAFILTWMQII